MKRSRTAVIILSATLALATPALAACGGMAEQAAEKAAGAAVGGDVNVDSDNGNVTITDESGKAVTIGENVALPDGWPSEVPAFDGGTLNAAAIEPDGTATGLWMVDGDKAADVVGAYGKTLEAAGFTLKPAADSGMPSMDMLASADYEGNGYTLNVSGISSDGKVMLTLSATKSS
jgi:ABC-type Fe3+-hydroxamate transport system substrate-binding protein